MGGYIAGQNVLVIGPGPLGMASVAAAKALGANRIFLSGTRASRLAVGKALGADRLIATAEEDPYEVVMRETNGIGLDYVIEVSGSRPASTAAWPLKAAKRNSKMLLLGATSRFPSILKTSLNDKDIFAIRGESRANVARAVPSWPTARLNLAPLVT